MNQLNNIAENMLPQEFPTTAFASSKFIELLEAGYELTTIEQNICSETVSEVVNETPDKTVKK